MTDINAMARWMREEATRHELAYLLGVIEYDLRNGNAEATGTIQQVFKLSRDELDADVKGFIGSPYKPLTPEPPLTSDELRRVREMLK